MLRYIRDVIISNLSETIMYGEHVPVVKRN